MKQFLAVFFIGMMIPYITTLAWTGWGMEDHKTAEEGGTVTEKQVVVIRDDREKGISVEAFLPQVLAAQIPADFEMETLKAQAVLARTYIYREIEAADLGDYIYEAALDMDAWSEKQMEERWGRKVWEENYHRLKRAVEETKGMLLVYGDELAEPLFCYASSGTTRSHGEDYPHLKQTESPGDLLAPNFLSVYEFSPNEAARKINEIPDGVDVHPTQIPGEIQIAERDSAGYVQQILVGQKTYAGEEIQYALGLPSSCYFFEQKDERIRVTCKGVGHGYGFAQYGGNEMAKEGIGFQELLRYYFQNVEIQSVH